MERLSQVTISLTGRMTSNHPDYLQQLCHNVWNGTDIETTSKNLEESISNTQLNLLKAILAGERKLTATTVMQQYRLGTPRNVSKNKCVLVGKDIVEIHGENIFFNDPIFEYWLRKN